MVVYGSPHFARRQILWDELFEIGEEFMGVWVIICDLLSINKRVFNNSIKVIGTWKNFVTSFMMEASLTWASRVILSR